MFLCLARVVTPRLTRAILSSSSVQAVRGPGLHRLGVGVRQHLGAAVLADVLAVMADEPVALAGDAVLQLTGSGELEALLDAALGLELGHFGPFSMAMHKHAAAALDGRANFIRIARKRARI